ncbi:hypothetical protein D3C76_47940 [compost metagenome]
MYDAAQGADFANGRLSTEDAWSRTLAKVGEAPRGKKPNQLDSEPMREFHCLVLAMYEQELDRQAENRAQMSIDEDFYDNIQWTPEDAQTLRDRGQEPLVYNVITQALNWVIGSEKRGRTDFRVLPRRKDAGRQAQRKTQLLKYLGDVNRTPFNRSRGFEDAVKVGVGWLEDGVQDDGDEEPVYSRYESWRNMLWDSASSEKDLSDCRYIFRSKWVDLDVAAAMFPKRIGTLNASARDPDTYGIDTQGDEAMDSQETELQDFNSSRTSITTYQRQRVRLIEGWIRRPAKVRQLHGGQFRGEVYDEASPGHVEAVQSGESVVVEKVMMRMHVCIFTSVGLLYFGESPYRHNKFPFTPIWCYRRGRDGLPYGMIRGMRDIQYDINKRAAKALYILSTNKVIMDEGAVEDLDEFKEEVSRPDAVIVKKSGKELIINAEREVAAAHMQFMQQSIGMIQTLSGVTDELLGRTTNATSGKAIGLRQEQGSMATAGIFDNLRFATQIQGEKQLSLVEQYFSEEKQFRITNMRGTPEYIAINDGLPENDITRTKADFVISESDWRATIRQGQAEELIALLAQLAPVAPQLAMVMIDLIVEDMDIGNREELVKRIRQVTGMRDPDAEEPTPEEMQAEQAKQQQAQLQQRAMMADIAKKEADATKAQADAQKSAAGAAQIGAQIANQNVATQSAALDAAAKTVTAPQVVPIADAILHESGFQSRTEQEEVAMQQAQQQAAAEQQAMIDQQAAEQGAQPMNGGGMA